MKKRLLVLTLALLTMASSHLQGDPQLMARARFVSYAIRDLPPDSVEMASLQDGSTTLEGLIEKWLATDEHKQRVTRFFYDFLGQPNLGAGAGHLMVRTDGRLHLKGRPACSETEASLVDVWWLDEKTWVCHNSISQNITFGEGDTFVNCQWPGKIITDTRCGCGPKQIFCIGEDMQDAFNRTIAAIPLQRALYAYEHDLTWEDLLGNGQLFGNRYVFFHYLFNNVVEYLQQMPTQDDINYLETLGIDQWQMLRSPLGGPERAPFVTDPNFMLLHNNPRSRIRALSLNLLCQDVTGYLNTDGIEAFVNEELPVEVTDHGTKVGCASCHFALDNMASTIRGWSTIAVFNPTEGTSQKGHVFGVTGEGANFLMASIAERGPGFHQCMAKRAWESFSGYPWAVLSESEQAEIVQWASISPRHLIRALIGAPFFSELR